MRDISHLEVGISSSAQATHPHLSEQDLAAGVGNESTVGCGDGETETRLVTPVWKLVGEKELRHLFTGCTTLF